MNMFKTTTPEPKGSSSVPSGSSTDSTTPVVSTKLASSGLTVNPAESSPASATGPGLDLTVTAQTNTASSATTGVNNKTPSSSVETVANITKPVLTNQATTGMTEGTTAVRTPSVPQTPLLSPSPVPSTASPWNVSFSPSFNASLNQVGTLLVALF